VGFLEAPVCKYFLDELPKSSMFACCAAIKTPAATISEAARKEIKPKDL